MRFIRRRAQGSTGWVALWVAMSLIAVSLLLIQTHRVVALFDLSYYTDSALRLMNGFIPYRDFPLFASPGSFLQLGLVLGAFGTTYQSIFVMMAVQSVVCCACVVLLVRRRVVSARVGRAGTVVLALIAAQAAPFGIYGLFHQPYYDADAVLWILIGGCALVYVWLRPRPAVWAAVGTGVALALPFVYKQTFGLAWVLVLLGAGLTCWVRRRERRWTLGWLGVGLGSCLGLFFGWLAWNGAVTAWYEWAVVYPTRVRGTSAAYLLHWLEPHRAFVAGVLLGAALILLASGIFGWHPAWTSAVLWTAPLFGALITFITLGPTVPRGRLAGAWIEWIGPTLFLWMVAVLVSALGAARWGIWQTIAVAAVAAVASGLLSQGYVGSSHAIWPLVFVLLAITVTPLLTVVGGRWALVAAASPLLASVFLLASLVTLQRYAWLDQPGDVRSGPSALAWVGTPGPYLEQAETARRLFVEYSGQGKTAVFPGEEPVAFLTGRIPAGPVSASDPTTNPDWFSIWTWAANSGARFVIVRRDGQYPDADYGPQIDELTKRGYAVVRAEGPFQVLLAPSR